MGPCRCRLPVGPSCPHPKAGVAWGVMAAGLGAWAASVARAMALAAVPAVEGAVVVATEAVVAAVPALVPQAWVGSVAGRH